MFDSSTANISSKFDSNLLRLNWLYFKKERKRNGRVKNKIRQNFLIDPKIEGKTNGRQKNSEKCRLLPLNRQPIRFQHRISNTPVFCYIFFVCLFLFCFLFFFGVFFFCFALFCFVLFWFVFCLFVCFMVSRF